MSIPLTPGVFVKGYKPGKHWSINMLPYQIQIEKDQLPPEKIYPLEIYTGGTIGNIGINVNSNNMGVT